MRTAQPSRLQPCCDSSALPGPDARRASAHKARFALRPAIVLIASHLLRCGPLGRFGCEAHASRASAIRHPRVESNHAPCGAAIDDFSGRCKRGIRTLVQTVISRSLYPAELPCLSWPRSCAVRAARKRVTPLRSAPVRIRRTGTADTRPNDRDSRGRRKGHIPFAGRSASRAAPKTKKPWR